MKSVNLNYQVSTFTYEDYKNAANKWKLSEQQIKYVIYLYPELKDNDLSSWTNEELEKFDTANSKKFSQDNYSEEINQKLKQRGILFDDLHWLLKDFHNIDFIFNQPDNVLKDCIEGYYKFAIDMAKSRLEYD